MTAPTSASWLNAVEGFFATLTKRPLERGVFQSVVNLQAAINAKSQSPSNGSLTPKKSSKPSDEGAKR